MSKVQRALLAAGIAGAAVGFAPLPSYAASGTNNCGAQYEIATRAASGFTLTTHRHSLNGATITLYTTGSTTAYWHAQGGAWSASPSGSWNCY